MTQFDVQLEGDKVRGHGPTVMTMYTFKSLRGRFMCRPSGLVGSRAFGSNVSGGQFWVLYCGVCLSGKLSEVGSEWRKEQRSLGSSASGSLQFQPSAVAVLSRKVGTVPGLEAVASMTLLKAGSLIN